MIDGIDEEIRRVVGAHGRLSVPMDDVGSDDDLYRLGMTSHATLNVMLALEEIFDVEFPDDLLEKSTFESVLAMGTVISELVDQRGTA